MGALLLPALAHVPGGARAQTRKWGEIYTLGNGLRVVLSPDRRFPTVTVLLRYHVGARQEPPGKSGIAHMVEHLTFRMSVPPTLGGPYSSLFTISAVNGATSYEHTEYFTTAPGGDLAYALWKERWRMDLNLHYMTDETRRQELDVIKNERRQTHEIRPYSAGEHLLWGKLFPRPHPFHEQIIGSMSDLEGIRLEEVHAFYRAWYGPNNATLAVVGDFDPEAARPLVAKYYEGMPRRPSPPPPAAVPHVPAAPIVLRHDEPFGKNPRLQMAWHAPAEYSKAHAAGEIAAMLLGGLHASRLVRDVSEAVFVSAYQISLREGSVFKVVAEPRPGVSTDTLATRIDESLARFREQTPTAREIDFAVRRILRQRFYAMEDSLTKAQLFSDIVIGTDTTDDPLAVERARFTSVRPADVQDFALAHLTPEKRVVLHALPNA
jgi:zinc protease